MASNRSRGYDDDDDDRPRRRRRDEDGPRSRRRKSNTAVVVAIVLGSLLAVGVVVVIALVAARNNQSHESDDDASTGGTITPSPFGGGAPGGNVPAFDAEGLPTGKDLDSALVRLNYRYRQNNYHFYWLELEHLKTLRKPDFTRGGEVFRALRNHAGAPAAQPPAGTIPFVAWRAALEWASKDEVPELCRMLAAERVRERQSDLFGKLAQFKDPRCAETVAPFLASPERRNAAEQLLKELDSTAERFVLPYLAANHARETRVAALQVVAAVGTRDTARVVEAMTRDPDLTVNHHAKIVFEKLSKQFGVEQDLLAVVKALKDGIAAQNPNAIIDADQQLTKAYRPDHPKRAEVFKGLIECCAVPDPKGYGKRAAFVGALTWSSKDDVEALCGLLIASGGESVVFLKLKEYKDPKCAEAVAAFLAVPLKGPEAAAVLKEIGAPAEKAVLPYTLRAAPNGAAIPFATRSAAIELLGDIGTAACVPFLRQYAADPAVQAAANQALAKVLARTKK